MSRSRNKSSVGLREDSFYVYITVEGFHGCKFFRYANSLYWNTASVDMTNSSHNMNLNLILTHYDINFPLPNFLHAIIPFYSFQLVYLACIFLSVSFTSSLSVSFISSFFIVLRISLFISPYHEQWQSSALPNIILLNDWLVSRLLS